MYRDQARYGNDPRAIVRTTPATFNNPRRWKEPRMVFVCSWSDFWIAEADAWRDDAWQVMRENPRHIYQIPTKRPERIAEHLPSDWGDGWPNVWLGVSIEDQRAADSRLPILIDIPARVRFISAEPLLGMLNIAPWIHQLDWVIAGGESGPEARLMEMGWARVLRSHCARANVPFFFKQQSAGRPGQRPWIVETDGRHTEWQEYPPDVDWLHLPEAITAHAPNGASTPTL
jgi:protein gp37